jgi:hypothetical protein
MRIMFGRKRPDAASPDKVQDSERTTSYRMDQDTAPPSTGVERTTSYVSAMQRNQRGYETIN